MPGTNNLDGELFKVVNGTRFVKHKDRYGCGRFEISLQDEAIYEPDSHQQKSKL